MYIGQAMMIVLFIAWLIFMWDDVKPQLAPCAVVLAVVLVGVTYVASGAESPAHLYEMWRDQSWYQ